MPGWFAAVLLLVATGASGQAAGGLYIAGAGFDFAQAAERALAQNAGGSRFFLLSVSEAVRTLTHTAPTPLVELRSRVARANVVFLVCHRDVDGDPYNLDDLIPGVVPVRGWPPAGSGGLPVEDKYYTDEDPALLPSSAETLRRLRATCS